MSTVNAAEIQNFSKDSDHWWDENGPFRPLHLLNPVRLNYFKQQICTHFDINTDTSAPYKGLDIIDVGCGGGLVCEPLARLGAKVTGIDADENAIEVATSHAKQSGLKIKYEATSSENMKKKYDVVLALEIIEHVDNPELFVQSIFNLCKPDGLVIFSTLNRTPKSYALGIVAAEHIVKWVPKGTHDWKKFVKPSELAKMIRDNNAAPQNVCGLIYNPFSKEFALHEKRTDVNYFITATHADVT